MEKKITPNQHDIKRLMENMKNGEYSIPRFQRDFVWEAKKVINLMNSVESGYPIGILLLAHAEGSPLKGKNEVIDIITKKRFQADGKVVVDGQQRLTSISIVYYATELIEDIKRNKTDTKTSKTIVKVLNNLSFYNGEFIETNDLVQKLMDTGYIRSEALKDSKKYLISNADINILVREKLNSKVIFTHTISGWSNENIIEIFTAINQKVVPLTHVELMNGAMFNATDEEFDLLEMISESNKKWINWGTIKNDLFVQLIKIFSDLKLEKQDYVNYKVDQLLKFAGDEGRVKYFAENKNLFIDTIKRTNSLLDKSLDIYSMQYLPKDVYYLSVFAIACLFEERNPQIPEIFSKVIAYISKRLVVGDYASSPNAKAMDDINNFVIKIASSTKPEIDETKISSWKQMLSIELKDLNYNNKNQALFKLVKSVLAKNHPKNLFDNGDVPVKPTENTKLDTDIHHFIPSQSTFSITYGLKERLDSIGNLTLLSSDENRNEIRAKDISEYLINSINAQEGKGNDRMRAIIESHLFNYELIMKLIDHANMNPVDVHSLLTKIFSERIQKIQNEILVRFFNESVD